jgi:hypothetical protein
MDRRDFLRASASLPLLGLAPKPARIRGRVSSAGSGVAGVVVSDGLSSVATSASGEFELASDIRARFVFLTLPRGYDVPARFYEPLAFSEGTEAQVSFELEAADDDGERHNFLGFGDTQIANASDAGKLHEATADVAKLAAHERFAFGVTCGDLVDDALELFDDYRAAIKKIGVPFFQVVGNHDLDAERSAMRDTRTYERHFGPAYYSFNRGAIHYVVLNDVFWIGGGYIGFISDEQLSWLASDLAHVEPGSPVVVFAHIPFVCTVSERIGGKIAPHESQVTNRARVLDLLEPFAARFITAHTHENEHVFHGSVHEHVLGTVCGAWWTGPICWDGTPNGFHVFEARGETLSWHFQATGQSPETQVRLYAPGADPRRPDEWIANVWNWDPEWKVVWYERGDRRGEMSRARGLDPMAVSLYQGEHKPLERGDWVEPILTDHLFYARGADITVEITDRFGHTTAPGL